MNEQEYKNAVQLLLSQEGNNYLLGLYFLLEHYSLWRICNLLTANIDFSYRAIRICFGNYRIFGHLDSTQVVTKDTTNPNYNDEDWYRTTCFNTEKSEEVLKKEIHKHLIRIFDSLV